MSTTTSEWVDSSLALIESYVDDHLPTAPDDGLLDLANGYVRATFHLLDALAASTPAGRCAPETLEAIATITRLCLPIWSNTHSAAAAPDSPASRTDDAPARVVRRMIAESRRAWEVVLRAPRTKAGSPPERILLLLEQMDAAVADRFRGIWTA